MEIPERKKKEVKKIIGGLTGLGALVVILLTIYEKTEAIISRVASRNPADKITKYSLDRYMNMKEPTYLPASKK